MFNNTGHIQAGVYQIPTIGSNFVNSESIPVLDSHYSMNSLLDVGNMSRRQLKKIAYSNAGLPRRNPMVPKQVPCQPTPSDPREEENFSIELALIRPLLTRCANVMRRTLIEAEAKATHDRRRKLVVFFSDIPPPIIGGDRSCASHKIPDSLKVAPSYRSFINRLTTEGVLPLPIWEKALNKRNVEHCLDIIMPTMYHVMTKLDDIMRRRENNNVVGMQPMIMVDKEWNTARGRHMKVIQNEWFTYARSVWQTGMAKVLQQLDEVPQSDDHIPYVSKEAGEVEWARIQSTIQGRLNDLKPSSNKTGQEYLFEQQKKSIELKTIMEMREQIGLNPFPPDQPKQSTSEVPIRPTLSNPIRVQAVSDYEAEAYAQNLRQCPPPAPSLPRPPLLPLPPRPDFHPYPPPRRHGFFGQAPSSASTPECACRRSFGFFGRPDVNLCPACRPSQQPRPSADLPATNTRNGHPPCPIVDLVEVRPKTNEKPNPIVTHEQSAGIETGDAFVGSSSSYERPDYPQNPIQLGHSEMSAPPLPRRALLPLPPYPRPPNPMNSFGAAPWNRRDNFGAAPWYQ